MAHELVTFENAKSNLELKGTTYSDDLIRLKLTQAQALVIDYVKQRRSGGEDWDAIVDAWDDESVPAQVQAAILQQLNELFAFRGDDAANAQPDWEYGYLSPSVTRLLHRLRDPALA